MINNTFMRKLNRALRKAEKVTKEFNGGDTRECYKFISFMHRKEMFHLSVSYEESLSIPFHEGIGFLRCDVTTSFTITKWNSKLCRSGTVFNSLNSICTDGDDKDSVFLSEVKALVDRTTFSVMDLDKATERRSKHYHDLINSMVGGKDQV